MGHSHDHHGGRQYYEEQLLTIGACGAFAVLTLVLCATGWVSHFLADKFFLWALLGGAALLAMTVINGVAVWRSAGKAKPAHGHDHAHDHAHENGHGHGHAHDHPDPHDHGPCDHAHDHVHAPGHVHVHTHDHDHDHDHTKGAVQTAAAGALAASNVRQDAPAVAAAPAVVPAPVQAPSHGDDGHDHGYAPWRYAVLLLPVAIYFVAPPGLSGGGDAIDVPENAALPTLGASMAGVLGSPVGQGPYLAAAALVRGIAENTRLSGVAMDKNISRLSFQELELAALYPENRKDREGKTVRLVGQYVPKDNHTFTLRRFKISCCAADAVPLNAVIMLDSNAKETLDASQLQFKWVQVTGRVQFLERPGGGYITALILTPDADWKLDDLVKEVPPPANQYLN